MNRKSLKMVVFFILAMIVSCDEPETVVTNIVHPDGSVTRKIEMKNLENKFKVHQVPFDNTWIVRDSLEINKKGDTTWVKRAEKLFKDVNEINSCYLADTGVNKTASRKVEFRKKFKWFNTEYRFAEIIDKKMIYAYPVSDFLNPEELTWFYAPDNINDEKKQGSDSLKYKALSDTVNKRTDRWLLKDLISEWIGTFSKLTERKAGNDMSFEALKAREGEFIKIAEVSGDKIDSLWTNGILLKKFIGEANALKYKVEADSAIIIVTNNVFFDFKDYTHRIIMPGKVIGTNGFIDSTNILMWPVKSDYFLTQQYEMWAESKTSNKWAWVVSGAFLLFVITGIIYRMVKKEAVAKV
jgi:hypothetical protein